MYILIADDHRVFFLGLSKLLEQHFPNAKILEAVNGEEVLSLVRQYDVKLVLLDIRMPGVMSIRFVEVLFRAAPSTRVIVLSMLDEHLFGIHFIRAGAHGFINKQADFSVLIDAIPAVLDGKVFFGRIFNERQIRSIFGSKVEDPFTDLSAREMDVLIHLFEGYGNKEIGEMLSLSPTTVSTYRSRIFEKLGTDNIFAIRDLYQLLQPAP